MESPKNESTDLIEHKTNENNEMNSNETNGIESNESNDTISMENNNNNKSTTSQTNSMNWNYTTTRNRSSHAQSNASANSFSTVSLNSIESFEFNELNNRESRPSIYSNHSHNSQYSPISQTSHSNTNTNTNTRASESNSIDSDTSGLQPNTPTITKSNSFWHTFKSNPKKLLSKSKTAILGALDKHEDHFHTSHSFQATVLQQQQQQTTHTKHKRPAPHSPRRNHTHVPPPPPMPSLNDNNMNQNETHTKRIINNNNNNNFNPNHSNNSSNDNIRAHISKGRRIHATKHSKEYSTDSDSINNDNNTVSMFVSNGESRHRAKHTGASLNTAKDEFVARLSSPGNNLELSHEKTHSTSNPLAKGGMNFMHPISPLDDVKDEALESVEFTALLRQVDVGLEMTELLKEVIRKFSKHQLADASKLQEIYGKMQNVYVFCF